MILLTEQALRIVEYSYQAVEQYNAKLSAMEDFLLRSRAGSAAFLQISSGGQ